MESQVQAPETLEGWYALHQIFALRRVRDSSYPQNATDIANRIRLDAGRIATPTDSDGWTAFVQLVGSSSALMLIHLRPTLEAIAGAERQVAQLPFAEHLELTYSFLSVTEAGMYHSPRKPGGDPATRGGGWG